MLNQAVAHVFRRSDEVSTPGAELLGAMVSLEPVLQWRAFILICCFVTTATICLRCGRGQPQHTCVLFTSHLD